MNTALLFVLVLGPLIFFHELGHFLVARLFGVGVEKFSLGFGPRLFGKKIGRTDYRLSLIPLGGFIKMVGDEPDAQLPPEDLPLSFIHKHVAKRSLIVFAGPFFNALLALLILIGIFYFAGLSSIRPVVKNIEAEGPGEKADLRLEDLIVSVNGKPVASWRDINEITSGNNGESVDLQIKRQGQLLNVTLVPQQSVYTDHFDNKVPYYKLGIGGMVEPLAIVGRLVDDMPAKEADLRVGDRIVAIDGHPIELWKEMYEIISASGGKELLISVNRQEKILDIKVKPQNDPTGGGKNNHRIGIGPPTLVPDEDKVLIKFGFIESVGQSFRVFGNISNALYDFIKNAFKGKVSRGMVGGPIRIAQMAKQSAQMGLVELFFFTAAISLQLALLNLLPIPVLDGGHLLFYAIEAIKRGPLSIRARETAQQVGLFLLLALMVFVLYNDIEFTWFK